MILNGVIKYGMNGIIVKMAWYYNFFLLFSFIAIFETCCQMFAYQAGDIGKLGILVSSEIAFTYILQALLLNTTENYLVYIGVVSVMMYSSIVFIEQGKQAKERLNALNENNDNTYDRQQHYDAIDGVEIDGKQEDVSMNSIKISKWFIIASHIQHIYIY